MGVTDLSAVDLAARIRDRTVSATDTVEAYLERAERRGPDLHAIVRLDADRARARARSADAALRAGELWGPLHGVPFTLHDVIPVSGIPASAGTKATQRTPAADGPIMERLTRAGAILLGKTNTALGLREGGELFHPAVNPYDTARTAGGISAGPAVAVSAGMSAFDVALDLDGSLRLAAHYCGVSGLRPTMHRIPMGGLIAGPPGLPRLDRLFSTVGPIARSPADLALVLRVIAGQDPIDPEVPPVPVVDMPIVDVRTLRVAYIPPTASGSVAQSIASAMERIAGQLSRAGSRVEMREPIPQSAVSAAYQRYGPVLLAIATRAEAPAPSPLPTMSPLPTPYETVVLLDERDQMVADYETFMDDFDVVIAPVTNTVAFRQAPYGSPIEIDGVLAPASSAAAWSVLATYLGAPAAVVPIGLDETGLPIGVQLLGKRWRDEHVLGAASAITRLIEPIPGPR